MKLETIVLKKDNITDFAKERNALLAKAKGEWIFFVDTDEKVTSELREEIASLLDDSMASDYQGFLLRRDNYFLGKYIGTDKIIRLARKKVGRWVRRVHETWEIKGRVGELTYPLIHNTAENLSDYLKKVNFYSTLHAQANKEEGKTSSLVNIILYPKMKFLVSFYKSHHFVFSLMQSFHSFLAWSKLWILQKTK
jgi:hypothetical protein